MNKMLYHLGNFLIVASLFGFIFTFYPLIKMYIFLSPSVEATKKTKGTFITISKINAHAPIIEKVDPWNEEEYKKALAKGVAHAKGTFLPGEKGTSFLFAHSSGAPWELTRFNTVFLRLGELEKDDTIIVVRDGEKFTYRVFDKKEIWPNEVSFLEDTSKNQLILQTCTPIGTSLKRLLIFATPQKV